WLKTALESLLEGVVCEQFQQLVKDWVKLELSYGSLAPQTKLSSGGGRPQDIGLWMKHRRMNSYSPGHMEDMESFASSWWGWWSHLNPAWRIEKKELLHDVTEGDWSCLRCPGQNGLWSVLICLRWWLIKEVGVTAKEGSVEWHLAVKDVNVAVSML
ncbi:hypothetical protein K435DRAFT_596768, partial [Dendrothele bispora CBS 962.96]